jgi:uncharacterized protein YndB with AHSA1/START domain
VEAYSVLNDACRGLPWYIAGVFQLNVAEFFGGCTMPFIVKFFVFMFALAVFAVIGAWIMGGESVKHSTSITVDASPGSVFRYLSDGEKIKQWGSDIVSVGTFSEDEDGGFSQDRVVRTEKGEAVWEDSVMRFQVGEAISIQSRKGGLTQTFVFQLEENDIGGTNLQYRLTRSAGGLDRLLFPFEEDRSETKMAAEMTKLKTLIESEVDPSDMSKPDEPIEKATPVDGLSDDGDNVTAETEVQARPVAMGAESIVDRVMGPPEPGPEMKQPIGERNFESLFGTGRPK